MGRSTFGRRKSLFCCVFASGLVLSCDSGGGGSKAEPLDAGDSGSGQGSNDDWAQSQPSSGEVDSGSSETEPTQSEGSDEPPTEDEPDAASSGNESTAELDAAVDGTDEDAAAPPALPTPAERLVSRLLTELDLGQASESWVANVTRAPLQPERVITPFRGMSSFEASMEYGFAFVDWAPYARFSHPTQFVFEEEGEELVIEDHESWPEIDGVGLVVSDTPLVKLFSPVMGEIPDDLPYPGTDDAQQASEESPVLAFYPDYESDSGEARLFFYVGTELAQGMPLHVNVWMDANQDGTWDKEEQVVENHTVFDPMGGWLPTDAFELPVDENNKFPTETWLQLTLSADALAADVSAEDACSDALSLSCTGEYYDHSTWSGPDCTSEYEDSGCSGSITWGPALENPPVPQIEGVETSYVCEPDGIVIPTTTKALVINVGDTPGRSDSEHEMNKAAAIFALHYGDEAVAKMNNPTAERLLEAVTEFVSGLKCLDEAHLYITGHGAEADGALWMLNGSGGVTPAQMHSAITGSAQHCPSPMDYDDSEDCRMGGYCNLSVYFTSCYSGKFLQGDASLALSGLNVLTAASATSPAYANLDGIEKGEQVGDAFVQGFVDNKADQAPYGNEDGVTDPDEAQRYAKEAYTGARSDPQLHQGADCACTCQSSGCGDGVLDPIEEDCDLSAEGAECPPNFECSETCGCECPLTPFDCDLGWTLDLEACECIQLCGNGELDEDEACDTAALDTCDEDFACNANCECECALTPEECGPPFGVLDAESCQCVPAQSCPTTPFQLTFTSGSVISDNPGSPHANHFDFLDGTWVVSFTPTDATYGNTAVAANDIVATAGTMINTFDGCLLNGSGTGTVAGNANSQCQFVDLLLTDDTATGQYQCCPSGYPCPANQPIVFGFEADVSED